MADEYDWDDDDFGTEDAQAGSNALRELRKANKQKAQQLREMQEQFQALQSQLRERSVRDVLQARGLNPKIAAFVPPEFTDSDSVAKWVDEFAEVFGSPVQAQDDAPTQTVSPDAAALNRISQTQQSGTPFMNDADQMSSRILNAQSPDELNEILFGSKFGPQVI